MNPIRTVTGLIQLPAHAAAAVLGTAAGIATTGARTAARAIGWAAGRAAGPTPEQTGSPWPTGPDTAAQDMEDVQVAGQAPAKRPATKTAAKKAPSRKAAVVAPALGLTEAEAVDILRTPSGIPAAGDGTNPDTTETDLHQPGTEPLMDPATAKSVASETEMLRRASETDKG